MMYKSIILALGLALTGTEAVQMRTNRPYILFNDEDVASCGNSRRLLAETDAPHRLLQEHDCTISTKGGDATQTRFIFQKAVGHNTAEDPIVPGNAYCIKVIRGARLDDSGFLIPLDSGKVGRHPTDCDPRDAWKLTTFESGQSLDSKNKLALRSVATGTYLSFERSEAQMTDIKPSGIYLRQGSGILYKTWYRAKGIDSDGKTKGLKCNDSHQCRTFQVVDEQFGNVFMQFEPTSRRYENEEIVAEGRSQRFRIKYRTSKASGFFGFDNYLDYDRVYGVADKYEAAQFNLVRSDGYASPSVLVNSDTRSFVFDGRTLELSDLGEDQYFKMVLQEEERFTDDLTSETSDNTPMIIGIASSVFFVGAFTVFAVVKYKKNQNSNDDSVIEAHKVNAEKA